MNQSRLWTIAAVILIVALLGGTWFLGVAPRLGDARDADTALQQAITLNNTHRQTLVALQAEHERIDEIVAELEEAHSVIPEGPDATAVLRTIDTLSIRTGVAVKNLAFAAAALYQVPDEGPSEFIAQGTELAAAGLYVMPVKIEVTGSKVALLNFVAALQSTQRYFHVYNAELLEDEETGPTLTVDAELFGLYSELVQRDGAPSDSTQRRG